MKWGFKRAFVRCATLFIAGAVFQFITGGLDNSFLRHPWGLIIAINYLYILILAYAKSDSWKWVRTLYDQYAMISSLASMVVLCMIFGLTAQNGSTDGIAGALGFRRMASSWPFCMIFIYFTTALGLRTIDDIHHWKQRRILPLLSHAAVFIVLAAGMFSGGDKVRVRLTAPVGYPVHTGITASGQEVRLPFVITLRKFEMKEYQPKLHMIDPQMGTSSAEYLRVEEGAGSFEGWDITVVEYLDMAGKLQDSTDYKSMEHVGAAPAAYVRAVEAQSGASREGWVSCGSHIFPPAMLQLSENQALAMPKREPEHYLSKIIVIDDKGESAYDIEVNNPAKVGAWRIYQVGYDTERGRWSTTSVLECVKDGWYPLIQTALWIILASGVAMALTAGRSRRKKEVAS